MGIYRRGNNYYREAVMVMDSLDGHKLVTREEARVLDFAKSL